MFYIQRTILHVFFLFATPAALAENASQDFPVPQLKSSSAQDEATGFIAGQSLSGTTRNFLSKELAERGSTFFIKKSGRPPEPTDRRDTWVQGTILDYRSGFTQGKFGFGVEVAPYNATALERGKGRIAGGGNRTLTDSAGNAVDQWSKLGLANVKARVSNTTLTVGRQNMQTPMIADNTNRALPSSFQGANLNSTEFNNLSVDLGAFDQVSPRTEQSTTDIVSEYGNRNVSSDIAYIAGAVYTPYKSVKASVYTTQVEDFWNQYYLGFVHNAGDRASLGLATSFNYYKTTDQGSAKMGPIDNDAYSLAFKLGHGAHTLVFAWQQVNGNEYFDYIHESKGTTLANSFLSNYNGPNEKSVQLAYILDTAPYGLPGLTFYLYNVRGFGIDGTHYQGNSYPVKRLDGDKHQESGLLTSYTVQSGRLKSSNVQVGYVAHRATPNEIDGNVKEFRMVTTIPFNVF
ncbi:outer membrane porin, OprD family [Pseudomonas sp. GM21]|uniref:OprD family outer membrane porin n=1 Tax=Pseudomonas sp. GM21 TaxID=1144325 RepID=UPI0002726B02|nr:OprD family outer membrane porin [Pseudomonas sp. GM21]EJM10996.1 outer membrane porin, OprD family [Pseudomonas sp. GM21]